MDETQKTGIVDKFGSILGSLFDQASNAFKSVGEFEINKYMAERIADARQAEAEADLLREQRLTGQSAAAQAAQQGAFGLTAQQQQYAALGFAAVGLVLLLRK